MMSIVRQIGLSAMAALIFCTPAYAWKDDSVVEDYQINLTLSNYVSIADGNQVWRVMIRIKDVEARRFLKLFPIDEKRNYPFFMLDFSQFTMNEASDKRSYLEKLYPLDQYETALNFIVNAGHILNTKIREAYPEKYCILIISDTGINFKNTGQTIPDLTFRTDPFDMTLLHRTERALHNTVTNYHQLNK